MNLIDVKNLLFKYKTYSGEKEEVIEHTAIDDISFSVKKGDFVGILGHNGSGKSTLARQLAALLKPSGGVIYVGGKDTAKEEDILAIRKTAGMVFQNPDNQLIGNIVEEDVAFGPENMGIPAVEIEERITKALAATGMTAYREVSPGALSGGQKQKVAISGVLAMEPECIIFDEPTAMLDPESRKELMEAIYDLKRLKNITVIYITHFLQEVSQADYLYIMNHGKITLEGTPESLFKMPEKLMENNLELPFEVALLLELRRKGMQIPEDIYTKQQLITFLKTAVQNEGRHDYQKTKEQQPGKEVERVTEKKFETKPEETIEKIVEKKAVDSVQKNTEETYENQSVKRKKESEIESRKGIILEHISYQYKKRGAGEDRYALKDVSLAIKPGEFVAIVGRTGSGKSTLIQHLNGLLQPKSGAYFFDGENIWEKKYDLKKLRQKVALCFQYPEYQLFEENVLKDIAFGPKNLGFDKKECVEKARHAMNLVGLSSELEKVSPFSLSGGQKRRVAIAGILAMEPDYLILDEPVAGMDAPGKKVLFELLHKLNKQGITIILVSHNMDDVANHADRVVVMEDGQIKMDGNTEEIFARKEELTNMGLGVPQTVEFYLELKQLGKEDSEKQNTGKQQVEKRNTGKQHIERQHTGKQGELIKKVSQSFEKENDFERSEKISDTANIPLNIEELAEYIAGGNR